MKYPLVRAIGLNVCRLRSRLNFTQEALAEMLGWRSGSSSASRAGTLADMELVRAKMNELITALRR